MTMIVVHRSGIQTKGFGVISIGSFFCDDPENPSAIGPCQRFYLKVRTDSFMRWTTRNGYTELEGVFDSSALAGREFVECTRANVNIDWPFEPTMVGEAS